MTAVPPQIPFHIFRIFQVEPWSAYLFSTKYLPASLRGPPTDPPPSVYKYLYWHCRSAAPPHTPLGRWAHSLERGVTIASSPSPRGAVCTVCRNSFAHSPIWRELPCVLVNSPVFGRAACGNPLLGCLSSLVGAQVAARSFSADNAGA